MVSLVAYKMLTNNSFDSKLMCDSYTERDESISISWWKQMIPPKEFSLWQIVSCFVQHRGEGKRIWKTREKNRVNLF